MTPSSPAGPSSLDSSRRPVPTVARSLVFAAKATVLRGLRRARDRGGPGAVRHPRGTALADAPVLAESRTPLWTGAGEAERALVLGKVHNLRLALRGVDGVEVPAGGVFGFWAHVGRATRRRGFVRGRELRQGCVIPSVGGGLCQLSNALYDAALGAGFEVVERHAHSAVVPGSAAAAGRDATVFWNYVDLRFRSAAPFRVEARMDADTLVVRLRGPRPASPAGEGRNEGKRKVALPALRVVSPAAAPSPERVHDCASCGMESCFRHEPAATARAVGRTAFLVDELWPEHDAYVRAAARRGDVLALPLDGARWGRPQYAWSTEGFARVRQSAWTALLRARASRRLAAQGAARQRSLLLWASRMARAHAAALGWDVEHAVVSQGLLPWLWRDGHLGGRTFDVLMTSLPLAVLHERLDHAARLHPRSPTLADFRAEPALAAAEAQALAAARRVVTPHAGVAALFAGRALRVEWELPSPGSRPVTTGGERPRVVFPASTLGRKGAYELREAARAMGVEVAARGGVLEGADFWSGIPLAPPAPGDWLEGAAAVALPAFVEHRPRRLLEAVARGVPVVASSACGVDGLAGVTVVPPGDAKALRHALEEVLAARAG